MCAMRCSARLHSPAPKYPRTGDQTSATASRRPAWCSRHTAATRAVSSRSSSGSLTTSARRLRGGGKRGKKNGRQGCHDWRQAAALLPDGPAVAAPASCGGGIPQTLLRPRTAAQERKSRPCTWSPGARWPRRWRQTPARPSSRLFFAAAPTRCTRERLPAAAASACARDEVATVKQLRKDGSSYETEDQNKGQCTRYENADVGDAGE